MSATDHQNGEIGEEPGETTRLLQSHHEEDKPKSRLSWLLRSGESKDLWIIVNLLTAMLIGTFAMGSFFLAITRILEDVLCRRYYEDQGKTLNKGRIDERLCKVDSIQEDLARIFATYFAIRAIVAVIVAFPWGIVADKFGRRLVFTLALLGISMELCSFALICRFSDVVPARLVVLTPLFNIIGGSNPIILSSILSIESDLVPESSRGFIFLMSHMVSTLGMLTSPSLAGLVMESHGSWPVVTISVVSLFICTIYFVLIIPETRLGSRHQPKPDPGEESSGSESDPRQTTVWAAVKSHARHAFSHSKESLSVLRSISVTFIVLIQLANFPTIQSTGQFMNQYVSKRYGISIAQTGYLSTLYGLANMVVAVVILPVFSNWMLKSSFFTVDPANQESVAISRPVSQSSTLAFSASDTPEATAARGPAAARDEKHDHRLRDLWLARGSYVVNIISSVILAVSPGIPVFIAGLVTLSLGSAFTSLTRALASMLVDERHRTRALSIVAISEEIGSIFGHPFLAELFALGMRLDKTNPGFPWIGLPYFGVAGLCGICLVLLMFTRVSKRREEDSEGLLDGQEEEEVGGEVTYSG